MTEPSSDALLRRFAQLPAARPLLRRLRGVDGVYLVGGAVRDLLLEALPLDLDLVVDGELEPVTALLGASLRAHNRFGTCTVALDGFSYDLARARSESYARPGALPTVAPATLDEDLLRRDFTVNALALGLGGDRRGELVAVPGGIEDLRRRRLRVLHDASFIDDPTRLLRLARYASRLGFKVEARTLALAGAAVAEGALGTVSGARLGSELRLLGAERDPVAAFGALAELQIDAALEPGFGLRSTADAALARRALRLLPADGDRGALVTAAASFGVATDRLAALLDRLAFPAVPRNLILAAATRARALASAMEDAGQPSEIAAVAAGAPAELVALAGALGPAAAARRWLDELRHVRLQIDGRDLLEAGIPQGPALGAGLAAARAARLDRGAGREEQLTEALRGAAGSQDGQLPDD